MRNKTTTPPITDTAPPPAAPAAAVQVAAETTPATATPPITGVKAAILDEIRRQVHHDFAAEWIRLEMLGDGKFKTGERSGVAFAQAGRLTLLQRLDDPAELAKIAQHETLQPLSRVEVEYLDDVAAQKAEAARLRAEREESADRAEYLRTCIRRQGQPDESIEGWRDRMAAAERAEQDAAAEQERQQQEANENAERRRLHLARVAAEQQQDLNGSRQAA